MNPVIKDFFSFSKQERRGIFTLLFILFTLVTFNRLFPAFQEKPGFDFSEFEKEINVFIVEQQQQRDSPDTFRKSSKPNTSRFYQQKNTSKPLLIELNTADTTDLVRLRGIGPFYAKRIIKYRKLLGGYYCKEQLLEVYGMDSSRYNQFTLSVQVDTTRIQKIDLNEASFKLLLRHPYLDYETVKTIVNHRNKYGPFQKISDLLGMEEISIKLYKRIKPYLEIQ
ncbi:MAG: helix-hairpin-helix domain-containing protein [Bacteroidetes bacterium]|nr:helix-hairpin-helix domain-containing protein [Bacteroidota bacterium]